MLENLEPLIREIKCRYAEIANSLEPADKQIMLNAAKDPRWNIYSLTNALRSRGINIGDKSVTRHMRGLCPCSKN